MTQQRSSPHALSVHFDHHVVPFPTRYVTSVPVCLPAQSAAGHDKDRQSSARTFAIRQVAVLEAAGRLSDVVQDLDNGVQLALAQMPRGVVIDLSAVLEGADPAAVKALAAAGRHVRDWPGIPVAVACPDPQVREVLEADPLGGHLIVRASLFSTVTAVLATPTVAVECLHLAPHPTAPRAAREFVTRTLLDWRLSRMIPFATLVVSELVASSSINAGTKIDVSVVWDAGALRLTVADHGPVLSGQPTSDLDLHGRALTVVAGLSRAFGALPTNDGGKVAWAVLDAPQPSFSIHSRRRSSRPETAKGVPLVSLPGNGQGNQLSQHHRASVKL